MTTEYHFARVSPGCTYKVRLPEDIVRSAARSKPHSMYITINHGDDGRPVEIFARYDVAEYYELITVVGRMASMALREGVAPEVVARELCEIHSPSTNHMVPGTDRMAISLTSRLGETLARHLQQKQAA